MDKKELHKMATEKSMEHWRDLFGVGSILPSHILGNSFLTEIAMKEFYQDGFMKGYEMAKELEVRLWSK